MEIISKICTTKTVATAAATAAAAAGACLHGESARALPGSAAAAGQRGGAVERLQPMRWLPPPTSTRRARHGFTLRFPLLSRASHHLKSLRASLSLSSLSASVVVVSGRIGGEATTRKTAAAAVRQATQSVKCRSKWESDRAEVCIADDNCTHGGN